MTLPELDPPCYGIKGVGATTAAVIVAEIGDFSRFKNASKLLSFAGMEPGYYQSGNSAHEGKMSKHGSRYLRSALMDIVTPLIRHNVVFAEYYHKKQAEGKLSNVAKSHTAKKLLRVIYTLHTKNIAYDPQKLR